MTSPGDPAPPPARPVDLHAHTTASDGTLTPTELVHLALDRGVAALAITDHDTIDGIAEARAAARTVGAQGQLRVIPGVELSTTARTTERGAEVHILGYGVDPDAAALVAELAELAASRKRRIAAMVERLLGAGIPLDADAVMAQADEGSIGRPHVARALIAAGHADSIGDAFRRWLKPGTPGWVPRDPFTPEQAVGLLVRHGAVPVLAHPWSTGDPDGMVRRLLPHGLRGIEVEYGEYGEDRRAPLRSIAAEHGLIATGGSDYHGPEFREGRDLGTAGVTMAAVEALDAAIGAAGRVSEFRS